MFSSWFLWQVATSKSLLLLIFKVAVQATMTVAHAVAHEEKENRFRSAFMQIKGGHCFFQGINAVALQCAELWALSPYPPLLQMEKK